MAFVNLLEAIYPIGTVYISTVNTSPSSLIGGTWTQITDAVLRAATSIGYIGSDTHAIAINEMPRHNHGNDIYSSNWTDDIGVMTNAVQWGQYTDYGVRNAKAWSDGAYTGGGKQCRLSSALTTALSGTEPRRFFGGDVNGIY